MREDNIKEFCYKLYRLFIVRNSCNTVGITIDRPDKESTEKPLKFQA